MGAKVIDVAQGSADDLRRLRCVARVDRSESHLYPGQVKMVESRLNPEMENRMPGTKWRRLWRSCGASCSAKRAPRSC
jgi:hypothetical protein